ncbi:Secretory carrier-associated membrane protein 1 [Chlorella vulgaris]
MAADNPFNNDNPFASSTNGTVPAAGAWNTGGAWGVVNNDSYSAPATEAMAAPSSSVGNGVTVIGGASSSKASGKKESELNKREAELNKREAELRRLELEIRQNPGAKSTKNWPKFCPILHHDIAGEVPAQSQIPVRRAYWAYLGLILCLFWNFIGGSALLITKSDQIAAWLWTALFLVGGVPGGYFLWYSRLYNAAIKDSAFGYAVFFAGFFANLAFSVWSAVGPPIAAKNSHCGYISAINKIGDNTGVGVIYFIGAGLWTLESLWSVWVYKSVYRSFRGQGMTAAQVKRDAKRGAASQAAASVVVNYAPVTPEALSHLDMATLQDAQPPAASVQQAGEPYVSPRKLTSAAVRADLVAQIRGLAESCGAVPDICKRRVPGESDPTADAQVADWGQLRQRKSFDMMQAYPSTGLQPSSFVPTSQAPQQQTDTSAGAASAAAAASLPPSLPNSSAPVPLLSAVPAATTAERQSGGGARQVGKVTKATKAKSGGRTFTSKYRGVHQTFPTRRWEAQFRRNGKPTSLGCFDHEEQAARAYDKMMMWCELHNATGVKGITNFDSSEYESEMAALQRCTQDDLKRDGAAAYRADNSASDDE